jgi:hypothetical protein
MSNLNAELITLIKRTFLKCLLPLPRPFARLCRLRGVRERGQPSWLLARVLLVAAPSTFVSAVRG